MPSDICNKEITINGKKHYWNRKSPFIRYLSSVPIGSRLNQCKQINRLKGGENKNGTARPRGGREKIN